jgi:hypothetical protein
MRSRHRDLPRQQPLRRKTPGGGVQHLAPAIDELHGLLPDRHRSGNNHAGADGSEHDGDQPRLNGRRIALWSDERRIGE